MFTAVPTYVTCAAQTVPKYLKKCLEMHLYLKKRT